ncbi:hypothetical protein [Acetobacter persici]|uniref:hypothetical protein n=1 Tax=Acetobacter persici TaxID=1076596 RepID=UPI001BA50055|nr:hypothetical protein [Acetobacter persici]MBS1014466.1 hypothetical protein [Acetobacter persici]
MTFIVSTVALMFLVYLGAGWLGVAESHRIQVALWGGGILGVLGAIGQMLGKPVKTSKPEKVPLARKPAIPEGRYTGGFAEDDLTPVEGGRSNMYCRLGIGYADAKGAITSRIIEVLSYTVAATPDGEVVAYQLDAYCEMRKADRLFRADRIVECHLADTDSADTEVKDLLATLRDAPATTVCDDQRAILHPVSMPGLEIEYMFRTPNFRRVTIQPTAFGYTERSRGKLREKTLLFIDGIAEGKTKPQRFKIDRINAAWRIGADKAEPSIAALFLQERQAD